MVGISRIHCRWCFALISDLDSYINRLKHMFSLIHVSTRTHVTRFSSNEHGRFEPISSINLGITCDIIVWNDVMEYNTYRVHKTNIGTYTGHISIPFFILYLNNSLYLICIGCKYYTYLHIFGIHVRLERMCIKHIHYTGMYHTFSRTLIK